MDTVWPVGTVEERPPLSNGAFFSGPGAFDMKGGLVQLVAALRAIHELGWTMPAELVVFVNSDEEIGSSDSRRWITPLARCVQRAYVLEGALGPAGAVKVGRKGVGRYRVHAKGRAAHAGLDAESGASAILELTHQIQALFGLNDPEAGITVNVGTIDGGMRPNVIAPQASAEVDVRVYSAEQAAKVDASIRGLTSVDPEVNLEIDGGFGRPPMERNDANDRLARRAQELARVIGLDLEVAVVGGASDANLTSLHTPTLDGLGAVGDGAHRLDEHIVLAALPERAALLAMLLMEPLSPTDREEKDP
ncbi:MAG: M20 family metallopeptidase [Acidimicrobiales bacterium]